MNSYSITLRDADDIERFFLDATGMKPGYFQLSKGVADLRISTVELDGVTLVWAHTPARVRWHDQMTGEGLHVGFAVESAGPITAHGRTLDADNAQVWMPGKEMDLIMAGPYLSLDIGVEPHLVEELGWRVQGEPLKKVPERHLAKLIRTCKRASRHLAGSQLQTIGSVGSFSIEHWRDLILSQLEPVLQPWLHDSSTDELALSSATCHYRLVKQAEDFFENLGCGEFFEVDHLAQSIGLPRRTIFHAYRKLLGIGPRRYFELKRLQTLRLRLKQAGKSDATVASIATELGFGDLGRLAALYRRQFGENPSETLKRA